MTGEEGQPAPEPASRACPKGHPRPVDQHAATPCAWPGCDSDPQDTIPGVTELPIGIVVEDGVEKEVFGTFWRVRTRDGWTWSLLATRVRPHP